jgi:hypothetical protein
MDQEKTIRSLVLQVRILKFYGLLLTLVVTAIVAYGFTGIKNNGHFKEVTAERVNIVERNGKLRMVISNKESQHPGMMDGKVFPKRDRPAGMIFFNDAGDECGGLVYDGDKGSASMAYSVDQWKNDQVMQLQYQQENCGAASVKSYGLKLWDRDDQFTLTKLLRVDDSLKKLDNTNAYQAGIEKLKSAGFLGRQRLFLGRDKNGEVGLFLNDAKGKPRLKIFINDKNQPVIETLDDNGKVIAEK